ncbi:MAG: ATP-dependent zinc metalloprotease FtsH [Eubacterium sp.]|nr:ATP-dependent zinc metalloprotease FtsH [Eubacterium sp.]
MNNQSPNNGNNNNNHKKNANGQMILLFLLVTLVALFFMSMFSRWQTQMTTKEISYTEFLKMVEEDKVEKVHVTSNSYRITPKKAENELVPITYFTGIAGNDLELVALLKEHDVEYYPYIPDDSATWIYNILSIVLPILLLWAVMGFLMRKMGNGMGMGVGKNTAKVYVEKKTGVTFKDVAGQDEAKESLQEVVDFLHNPQKYTDIGAKLPKGALLVGPPGTGKTLLAKAVAGEANVPFFSLAGSDFVEMFVGVGASRVRDLFKEAQKQAPCIIFIDEIDAIGKSRDTRYGSGNDEREQTLNQLLAEMDGFDTSKGLLILAATNRPEVLDKALLRPGRFDRRIIVEKPDLKGRVETLKVHSKDVLMDETVDLDAIALATSGAVGSDLANMINEAAINAVKNGRKYVNQSDLFESVEVVIAGKEKKDRILGKEEKRIVAYHEVGHALTTALQKDAEPVQKITIVPRTMGALGYVMQVPEEEKYLMSEEELKARLVTFMAGRAAEELVFHSITTGASNDIEKATQIARAMVTQYGMSKKFGLISLESVENRYLDGRPVLNCGDDTAAEIDQEVQVLLKESYETAKKLLEENREVLDRIAEYLFEHETITGKEFMRIYRDIKGIPQPPEEEEKHPVHVQGLHQPQAGQQNAAPYAPSGQHASAGQNIPAGQQNAAPYAPAGQHASAGQNIPGQQNAAPYAPSGQNTQPAGQNAPYPTSGQNGQPQLFVPGGQPPYAPAGQNGQPPSQNTPYTAAGQNVPPLHGQNVPQPAQPPFAGQGGQPPVVPNGQQVPPAQPGNGLPGADLTAGQNRAQAEQAGQPKPEWERQLWNQNEQKEDERK